MSGDTELLVLRLALVGIIFLFVLAVAFTMRSGVLVRTQAPARSARPSRGPRLVVEAPGQTGLDPGASFALAGRMTIGRDAGNGIVIGETSVSTRHAAIERTPAGWRLADLGSTNGTVVNGHRLDRDGMLLRDGDRVALGAVLLRFQDSARG